MQKPDFSGEWTLNAGACALGAVVAPVVQSGFVRIEHREPSIAVHLSITMDGKPFDVRFELTVRAVCSTREQHAIVNLGNGLPREQPAALALCSR